MYVNRDAAVKEGYKDSPATPTYITVPVMWTNVLFNIIKDMKINFSRVLHGEETYEYLQEIYPGDILTGRMKIVGMDQKSGKAGAMDIVKVEFTYTNQRNEPGPESHNHDRREKVGRCEMSKEVRFGDIAVGSEMPVLVKKPVDHMQLVRYAGASGDFNPLHTDPEVGKKVGIGQIAHGMLIMGFVGQAITDLGPQEISQEIQRPLCRHDKARGYRHGNGKSAGEIADGNKIMCDVQAKNQKEEVLLAGFFEAVLP